jgi:uracil-DNA glycosylase
MATSYDELLEATIRHLESLKSSGTRFIEVSPPALAGLSRLQPAMKPAVSGREGYRKPVLERPGQQMPHDEGTVPSARLEKIVRDGKAESPPQSPITTPPTSAQPALSPEAKAAAFADLRRRALECMKCPHLASSRKNVVFGVGNMDAELMFVGEAPGADEDEQGEPFVGKAGQLLTKIIETMGLKREGVYIANILKCRPDTPGQSAGNRKPRPEEMETCIPFLHEQIDLIRPRVLVALGGTAMEGLLSKPAGIMKLRGQWHTYRGIPLMPTFHPAYVLRNQALSEKRKVWEDMLQVMERLGLTISEKQRAFFTKA